MVRITGSVTFHHDSSTTREERRCFFTGIFTLLFVREFCYIKYSKDMEQQSVEFSFSNFLKAENKGSGVSVRQQSQASSTVNNSVDARMKIDFLLSPPSPVISAIECAESDSDKQPALGGVGAIPVVMEGSGMIGGLQRSRSPDGLFLPINKNSTNNSTNNERTTCDGTADIRNQHSLITWGRNNTDSHSSCSTGSAESQCLEQQPVSALAQPQHHHQQQQRQSQQQGGGERWQQHDGVRRKNRVAQSVSCKYMGCTKLSRGVGGFCVRHGGGHRCQFRSSDNGLVSCPRVAQGRSSFCKRHGGGNKCKVSGCKKTGRVATQLCNKHMQDESRVAAASCVAEGK